MNVNLIFNWNSSIAKSGIFNYRFYCNDIILANTSDLSYTFENADYNVDYIFYVRAISNDGAISKKSNIINVNIKEFSTKEFNYNLNIEL